jgi:hypothetical protein
VKDTIRESAEHWWALTFRKHYLGLTSQNTVPAIEKLLERAKRNPEFTSAVRSVSRSNAGKYFLEHMPELGDFELERVDAE